jgi:hypothetical protein
MISQLRAGGGEGERRTATLDGLLLVFKDQRPKVSAVDNRGLRGVGADTEVAVGRSLNDGGVARSLREGKSDDGRSADGKRGDEEGGLKHGEWTGRMRRCMGMRR